MTLELFFPPHCAFPGQLGTVGVVGEDEGMEGHVLLNAEERRGVLKIMRVECLPYFGMSKTSPAAASTVWFAALGQGWGEMGLGIGAGVQKYLQYFPHLLLQNPGPALPPSLCFAYFNL